MYILQILAKNSSPVEHETEELLFLSWKLGYENRSLKQDMKKTHFRDASLTKQDFTKEFVLSI